MTKAWKLACSVGLPLSIGVLLSGCAVGPSNPSTQLAKQIETARTPADHEVLVKYYVRKAAASRVSAEKYRQLASSVQTSSIGGRGYSNPKARYNSIINVYEGEAAEYERLAEQQQLLVSAAHQ